MRILITGASGFIGNALKIALKEKYPSYTIFTPSSKELNLLELTAVENYIKGNNIDTVYHVAAKHAGVGTGINKSLYFLEVNLMMNYNIVVAARKHGVKKIITFGSSCTYKKDLTHPAKETDLWDQQSENTYGTCKQVLLEHLQSQDSMTWVYLIPPNLYGPGDHFGETGVHFIPATVQKFQNAVAVGDKNIVVWGDGTQTRDFVYLTDIINILLDSLHSDKYDNQPINVATGVQVSIREIAELIREKMELNNIEILWDKNKPTGAKSRELDASLLMNISPDLKFTSISDGIEKTISWYRNGADCEDVLC